MPRINHTAKNLAKVALIQQLTLIFTKNPPIHRDLPANQPFGEIEAPFTRLYTA
jgi:hypothetical protein